MGKFKLKRRTDGPQLVNLGDNVVIDKEKFYGFGCYIAGLRAGIIMGGSVDESTFDVILDKFNKLK